MTKWPVQKQTHRTPQKHVEHHDTTDNRQTFLCFKKSVRPMTQQTFTHFFRVFRFKDSPNLTLILILTVTDINT